MLKLKKFVVVYPVIFFLLTACSSSSTHHPMEGMNHSKAEKPSTASGTAASGGGTYIDQAIGNLALSADLFDSEGKKFSLGSLNGKYLVIANFLTSCQEICPMTSANMRDIGDALFKAGLSNKIESIALSVDGNREIGRAHV